MGVQGRICFCLLQVVGRVLLRLTPFYSHALPRARQRDLMWPLACQGPALYPGRLLDNLAGATEVSERTAEDKGSDNFEDPV